MTRFLLNRRARARAYRRSPAVLIRWATAGDEPSVKLLAQLDEAAIPPAPLLLGFLGDELCVAVSLSTWEVVSDPFKPTLELAALVTNRGRQLTVKAAA